MLNLRFQHNELLVKKADKRILIKVTEPDGTEAVIFINQNDAERLLTELRKMVQT